MTVLWRESALWQGYVSVLYETRNCERVVKNTGVYNGHSRLRLGSPNLQRIWKRIGYECLSYDGLAIQRNGANGEILFAQLTNRTRLQVCHKGRSAAHEILDVQIANTGVFQRGEETS